MSFSDVYRKTLLNKGGSVLASDIMHSKNTTNRTFTNDYTYKKGQLQKLNMEIVDIDTRRVSKDKNTYDKDIYFRPDTIIDVGSYLIYDDGVYLVDGFNKDYINPKCMATECNQLLSFSFTKNPIYCIAEGESYGVKITGGTEFNAQVDTKVKVTVQDNEETRKLKPDHRFIFNHSEYGIYKIGDITVYKSGLLTLTCQKDQYQKGYDDLENNIAYNGVIPDEPTEEPKPVAYKILGCDSDNMVINTAEIFTLEPQNNNVEWKLNEEYEVGVAEIISTNDSSCTVKCLKADNVFELKALIDNEEVGSRVIFTSKR